MPAVATVSFAEGRLSLIGRRTATATLGEHPFEICEAASLATTVAVAKNGLDALARKATFDVQQLIT